MAETIDHAEVIKNPVRVDQIFDEGGISFSESAIVHLRPK
jgi:hypothetical protein